MDLSQAEPPPSQNILTTILTYDLVHKGRKYSRATAELRPYKKGVQWQEISTPSPIVNTYEVNGIVAYLENSNDSNYHIGKIATMGDDIVIDAWATTAPNIVTAKWKPLQQIVASQEYTLQNNRAHHVQVQDFIPQQDVQELIIAKGLKQLTSGKLDGTSRVTLEITGKTHHRLGHTFP